MQYSLRFSYVSASIVLATLIFLFPHTSFAAQVTISMTDTSFTPNVVTINPGDTVKWVNSSSVSHTVTGDDGSFDSGTVASAQSFVAMFNAAGTYAYHCKLHGGAGGVGMAGRILVVSPSSGVSTNTNTNTTSVAQLQAQAQVLLNQVAVLQAQLGTGGSPAGVALDSSSCPLIGRSLRRGVSGDDVKRLQQFLARDPSIYPEAIVSGYYGALTEKAVQRWQTKYNIVSSGTPDSTGYGVVGPRTAAAIALLCTTGSYGGIPGPAPVAEVSVGRLITVTPISGTGPLAVNIVATVNTVASCLGATYVLDFGDGTPSQQIPVAAGNCQQFDQTYSHTYKYNGNYIVKLSAAGHESTATVTVTGAPAPVFTPGLPAESFSASPVTGSAPLSVTFAGIVNSNDLGFCIGGCASILDFGDGSQASVNLPSSIGGWLNYSVTHVYTLVGGFRATLYQGGAGASQPILGAVTIIVGPGSVPTATTTATTTPAVYSYSPPSLSSSGANSLLPTISFDLPSACTGYSLSWGDGSAAIVQSDGGSSCAQTPVIKSFTRQFSASGSYTILLKRGPTLSRIDDISLTISN